MATRVTIPTGVTNRRGSDGSGFAIGKQSAAGVPLDRVNYVSVLGSEVIGIGLSANEIVSFFADDGGASGTPGDGSIGYGTIVIATTAVVSADTTFTVTGRDADGNEITEDITVTSGASTGVGAIDFACVYLTTITPDGALAPATVTWGATLQAVANVVTNGMRRYMYPVSNLDMNENANIEDSDLISSLGAAEPPDIGQYSATANFTTGLLTEDMPPILDGIFNNPTSSTPVPIQDADAGIAINPPEDDDVALVLPDNSALMPPQPDGTLHPSKLKIVFATAPMQAGSFTIVGFTKIGAKQNNLRRREETIEVNTTQTEYESDYYYAWDAATPLEVTSSFSAQPGAARFTLDPELYEIIFTIARNDVQFPGYSVQGLVGGEPRTGYDVVPSLMNITSSPGGVSFEMQCPGGQVTEKRTIQGGHVEQPFLDAYYEDVESRRYGGWSGAFRFGTDLVKMTNLVIGFNRSYAADTATDGDRFATDIEASDDRAITIVPTTRFQSSYERNALIARWQEIFRDEQRTALDARWYNYTNFGQRRQFIVECPSSLLIQSPQTTVGGGANIDRVLNFQAFATNAAREITITLLTTKSYSV